MAAIELRTRSRATPRIWSRLSLAVGVAFVLFAVVLSTGAGGSQVSQAVSNFGLGYAAVSAAVACLVRARWLGGRARAGWLLIGLGALSWALGQATWAYIDAFHTEMPAFPSTATIGYLGLIVFTSAGLLVLPSATQALANRIRSVIDGLMVAISLALIAWIFVVSPMIVAGQHTSRELYAGLAYPFGDIVMLTIVLYMLAQQRAHERGLGALTLIAAGMAAFAASDVCYAYFSMIGSYRPGDVSDIGWFAGFGLLLLAAMKPLPPAREEVVEAAESNQPVCSPRSSGTRRPATATCSWPTPGPC
jgi:hypothetical protein